MNRAQGGRKRLVATRSDSREDLPVSNPLQFEPVCVYSNWCDGAWTGVLVLNPLGMVQRFDQHGG